MLGRYNIFTVFMLNIHKLRNELSLVVIIDDSNSSGDLFARFPFFFNELLTNKITKRFGTVSVILLLNKLIKLLEQYLFDERIRETPHLGRREYLPHHA